MEIAGGWPALLLVALSVVSMAQAQLITDETLAAQWLREYNEMAEEVYYKSTLAAWTYNTNLTDYNSQKSVEGEMERATFRKEAYQNASKYDWKNFQDEDIKRQFAKVTDIGPSVLEAADIKRHSTLEAEMDKIYSTAKVCNETKCFPMEPDLTRIMAKSRDWDELLWLWKRWRDVSGKQLKSKYRESVELQNSAARQNGYADSGEYWRSWYESDTFEPDCFRLWEEVKPLYQHLHAYVKRKLMARYADREFPSSGHIPAHILGDMWGQQWVNLADIVTPYPSRPPIDVTTALVEQGYTAQRIFNMSEEFFTSLGLIPMTTEFWQNSMIEKPDDREVVCHASAWDFTNGKDFRIKQCTDITQKWLETTHHEMGHIEYDLQYKDKPIVYRSGANPAFHEAVGDVMGLSVSTPEHLKEIGLLKEIFQDEEYDINFLMGQALEKIAFLPFGFLIDQWRWSVFRGEVGYEDYNRKWWELRCKHQGVSPPVIRDNDDFDPGAKYHIPVNVAYIRYFVSFIIQFQFSQALCDAAGYNGSLHHCDIYRSTAAGKKLGDMLALGSSKPWPEAMEAITGQRDMSASALIRYFQPLYDWLKVQNEGHDIDWDDECPDGSLASAGVSVATLPIAIAMATILACLLIRK